MELIQAARHAGADDFCFVSCPSVCDHLTGNPCSDRLQWPLVEPGYWQASIWLSPRLPHSCLRLHLQGTRSIPQIGQMYQDGPNDLRMHGTGIVLFGFTSPLSFFFSPHDHKQHDGKTQGMYYV